MKRLIVGLVGVIVVGAGVACGDPSDGGGGDAERPLTTLQAAAEAVDEAGSARVDMTMTMEAGIEVHMSMEGTFDLETKAGEGTVTIDAPDAPPGTPGLSGTTKMIVDGTYLYMKGPFAETYGGSGTGWARVDTSGMPGMSAQMNQDPSQYVDFLRAAGAEPEEVGTEMVRGTETTHYRGEIAFEDLLEHGGTEEYGEQLADLDAEVAPVTVEAWIAEDGLPRRLTMAMEVTGIDGLPGGTITTEGTVELYDYGVEVDVKTPKKFEELAPPVTP